MAYLLVREVPDYEEGLVRRCLTEFLDRSGLEWRGRSVLVKPNLLGPFPPQSAVVTHPMVIRILREELQRRGSRVTVGDNPGIRGYGMVARTAEVSGAAEAAGECFANISGNPRTVDIPSRFVKEVAVSSEVLEADLWVSVPKFKTHVSTVLTGAIKNSYGLLVGAEKARLHSLAPRPCDFGELLVDVYAIRPPDLVIMDAVWGMEGNGPSAGRKREIGYLLASDSGGAMDLAMCHMMGAEPRKVHSQRCAMERGLAPRRITEVLVDGELPVLEDFKLPSTLASLDPAGLGQKLVFRMISRPRMKVNRELCTACGSCVRGCPVKAVSLDDYPRFDHKRCIACYCCYELCPQGAVRIRRFVDFLRG